MDVALSRRAAFVVAMPVCKEMSLDERLAFSYAVDAAPGFDALPERWRRLIEQGEAQWAETQKAGAR
jgi:hypothetical protein